MKTQKISFLRALILGIILSLSSTVFAQQYTLIPDSNFEAKLISLKIDKDGVNGKVLTSSISGLTKLDVSGSQISDLTGIQDFTALNYLYCDNNQLTSLDVTKNTALTTLWFSRNLLTSLDVTQNTALNELLGNFNDLTSFDVSKNTSLTNLSLYGNKLTSLNVQKNIALKSLTCTGNALNSLDVTQNVDLISMSCNGNSNLKTICVASVAAVITNSSFIKDFTAEWSETCVITDLYENNFGVETSVYPNPTQGQFTVSVVNNAEVSVVNILGKEVMRNVVSKGNTNVSLEFVPAGIYLVRINSGNKQSVHQLVVE